MSTWIWLVQGAVWLAHRDSSKKWLRTHYYIEDFRMLIFRGLVRISPFVVFSKRFKHVPLRYGTLNNVSETKVFIVKRKTWQYLLKSGKNYFDCSRCSNQYRCWWNTNKQNFKVQKNTVELLVGKLTTRKEKEVSKNKGTGNKLNNCRARANEIQILGALTQEKMSKTKEHGFVTVSYTHLLIVT